MKKITLLIIPFFCLILNAQNNISVLKLEESDEATCRIIEEKLYLNSILNKSNNNNQDYVDSLNSCMGDSPELFLITGKYFYNNKEYKASITEFKKVIELSTSNQKHLGEAFYYLASAHYYIREYESSIEFSKQVLEIGYNTSWTYNNIGLATAQIGNWAETVTFFEKALEADPSNDVAACNLGWAYGNVQNDKEALKYYLYADSLVNGNNALYISNIIRSLVQLQRGNEAFIIAENAYKKFPNDKNIIEDYSKVLFKQQNYQEILPLARKLLQMHPSSARDWGSIAYIYDNAGQEDSAYYFYKLCLKYDPEYSQAYGNISKIYKELGLFEKAHTYVDMALSIDSNNHYYYRFKSDIYLWEHDFESSYLWRLKSKQRFPERKGHEFNIGYSLQQLKKYSEAIPFFKTTLIDKPNDDRVLNNIGRCYAELGQQDSAFIYFEKALKINPENSYAYHNRAALYYDIKRFDLACQDLKQAIDKEYNWVIDDKLIEMTKEFCPEVNTNLKVLIYAYKGNVNELSGYNFIQLSDSMLNKAIDITIKENDEANAQTEENQTLSTFNSFNLYPNPSNGVFNIESQLNTNEIVIINIYNSEGKLVISDNMIDDTIKSFNLQNTPAGLYVVIISNQNSVLSTKKLLIEN